MTKNKIKAKTADDKNLQAPVWEELSDSESAAVCGGKLDAVPPQVPIDRCIKYIILKDGTIAQVNLCKVGVGGSGSRLGGVGIPS